METKHFQSVKNWKVLRWHVSILLCLPISNTRNTTKLYTCHNVNCFSLNTLYYTPKHSFIYIHKRPRVKFPLNKASGFAMSDTVLRLTCNVKIRCCRFGLIPCSVLRRGGWSGAVGGIGFQVLGQSQGVVRENIMPPWQRKKK